MEKQTAVEWLWEQIDNIVPFQNIQTSQIFNGLLEQAKQMEKQQIKDAYKVGIKDEYVIGAEQYYKQTFNQ
jgi:hypothetical protein